MTLLEHYIYFAPKLWSYRAVVHLWLAKLVNQRESRKDLGHVVFGLPKLRAGWFKGTQDWEFFWLRFWNLRYFFDSYVKILKFYNKFFFDWAIIGGGTIFPRSPRTTRYEKKFWARSKFNFFIFFRLSGKIVSPPILAWSKKFVCKILIFGHK